MFGKLLNLVMQWTHIWTKLNLLYINLTLQRAAIERLSLKIREVKKILSEVYNVGDFFHLFGELKSK